MFVLISVAYARGPTSDHVIRVVVLDDLIPKSISSDALFTNYSFFLVVYSNEWGATQCANRVHRVARYEMLVVAVVLCESFLKD